MSTPTHALRIGTAGWGIPADVATRFPGDGQHLERYARVLNCAEVNSSFSKRHRPETWTRWAAMTPAHFRFSAKLPRAITHEARLVDAGDALAQFLADVAGLGDKLAVLLVQLPPSLAFDADAAGAFFRRLRRSFDRAVACEPRHASWFTADADAALVRWRVSRVAADPADPAGAPISTYPGGWLGPGPGRRRHADPPGVPYHRWHGSPRRYWASYDADWLRARAAEVARWPAGAEPWCLFDNTAAGAATANALDFATLTDP